MEDSGFGSVAVEGIVDDPRFIGNMSTQAVMNLIKFTDLGGNESVSITPSQVERFAIPARILSDVTNSSGILFAVKMQMCIIESLW